MTTLLAIFLIVFAFSVLTTFEVIILQRNGIDVFAHMKATWDSGRKFKFFFEAFGLIAFVLIQPVLLTATVVWAFGEIAPVVEIGRLLLQAIITA